jgi:hypothetical protein
MPLDPRRALVKQCLRKHGAALTVLGLLWAGLVLSQTTPWLEMWGDTDVYLGLARSLSQGDGYTLDGEPYCLRPPLFPALLSVLHSPTRGHYRPENLLMALAGLGALLGTYAFLAHRCPGRRRIAVAVLVAVSPAFVRMAGAVMTDALFLGLSMGFLVLADRFWRRPQARWPAALGASVMLGLAVLTRTAAVAFYAGALLWLAWPWRWRRDARRCLLFAAVLLLVAGPPLVGWQVWKRTAATGRAPSYTRAAEHFLPSRTPLLSAPGLRAVWNRVSAVVSGQLIEVAEAVYHEREGHGARITPWLIVPLLMLGLMRRLRRCEPSDLCFCFYAAMVLLWPFRRTRLWLPVLPLLIAYLAEGADVLGRAREAWPRLNRWAPTRAAGWLLAKLRPVLLYGGGAVLLAGGLADSIEYVKWRWERKERVAGNVVLDPSRQDLVRFIAGGERRPMVVAHVGYLETRPAVHDPQAAVVPLPEPAGEARQLTLEQLTEAGATHLAIESGLSQRAQAMQMPAETLVAERPDAFRLCYESRDLRVYEIVRASAAP